MRALIHYLFTMVVIPIYGIQVCPYIESLPAHLVIIPVWVALSVQFALRHQLRGVLVENQPLNIQVRCAFWLELGLFIASAIALMVYNTVEHDFPLVSGLKVLTGIGGLGFFAAVDLALEHEQKVAERVQAGDETFAPESNPYSMSQKVGLFAAVSIGVLITVFMLLVVKDLDWIVEVGKTMPLEEARASIIKEFIFVLLVVMPHALNIIRSYTRNLNSTLTRQTIVLNQVTHGNYGGRVPVASNDEFGRIAMDTNTMVDRIEEHTAELARTRDVTILSLATLAETRDNETGAHILRTQRYVRILADQLKDHPAFKLELTAENRVLIFKSAPLHDIGKVGIPDAILLKPGKLTDEEFEIMKTHAQLGADALAVSERELGSNSFLHYAREIALTHQEKWDGSGYPGGLKGTEIPISGRLMAVADVYDALISARVYKPAFSHEKAMGIIRDGAGQHFDADIVDAMNATEDQFKAVAKQYGDIHTQAAE